MRKLILLAVLLGNLGMAQQMYYDPIQGKLVMVPRNFTGPVTVGATVTATNLPVNVLQPPYSARADGVIFTDGAITSSSTAFTSAATTFTSADVGKLIQVHGAGGSTAVTSVGFVGSGLSTVTFGGTYTGTSNLGYCVQVASTSTFDWGTYTYGNKTAAACTNGATGVTITGSAQTLGSGVTVTFGSASGYTTGDKAIAAATTGTLATAIASYTSAHVVQLTVAATRTVSSGGKGAYGTDNATAIAAAIAAVAAGGVVEFPAGVVLTSARTLIQSPFVALRGNVMGSTLIYAGSGAVDSVVKFAPLTPGDCVSDVHPDSCLSSNGVRDLQIRGNAVSAAALYMLHAQRPSLSNVILADAPTCLLTDFVVLPTTVNVGCTGEGFSAAPKYGYLYIPTTGWRMTGNATGITISGTHTNFKAEGVLGVGIDAYYSTSHHFSGGSAEGSGIGIRTSAVSAGVSGGEYNTFSTMDVEANIFDADLQGEGNVLDNLFSQDPVVVRNSDTNSLVYGTYNSSVTLYSTAVRTGLHRIRYGSLVNSGASTIKFASCLTGGVRCDNNSTPGVLLPAGMSGELVAGVSNPYPGWIIPNGAAYQGRNNSGTAIEVGKVSAGSNDVELGNNSSSGGSTIIHHKSGSVIKFDGDTGSATNMAVLQADGTFGRAAAISLFGGSASPTLALAKVWGCTHGSNATCGVAALSSGTVTVNTTSACTLAGATGCVVLVQGLSCSSCGHLSIGAVVDGTSFAINSTNGSDASSVYWEIKYVN